MGLLTVFLDKCTNLADTDGPMNQSDPYVMLHVEQDNMIFDKNYGKKTSSCKKGTRNPVYGETFTFEDVPEDMKNMVLHVKVMDKDIGLDDKLGKCSVKLDELGLTENPTGIERAVDNNVFTKDGKIYLQISYKA